MAKPKCLLLAQKVDALAEELGNYSRAETKAVAMLAAGELVAEGLPIDNDPKDYTQIPAGWWVPELVLPAKYGSLRTVERSGGISELTGVTFVDSRHSLIWRNTITDPPARVGFRAVRVCDTEEKADSLNLISSAQLENRQEFAAASMPLRGQSNPEVVRKAVEELEAEGKRPGIEAIRIKTGLSRTTVKAELEASGKKLGRGAPPSKNKSPSK